MGRMLTSAMAHQAMPAGQQGNHDQQTSENKNLKPGLGSGWRLKNGSAHLQCTGLISGNGPDIPENVR